MNPRPPIYRPPGHRPPGYRPPGHRPPYYRPPYYRPPYYRPPHYYWGAYYWYPRWGWYFTAAVAGATLVYVATLPTEDDSDCQEVNYDGETLYVCNGTLYRPALLKDEVVYEIVSEPDEVVDPVADTITKVAPEAAVEATGDLRLTTPRMKGERVRRLQEALKALGYNVGTVDGVFGPATENVVRKYQANVGLDVTGVVDQATANALGV